MRPSISNLLIDSTGSEEFLQAIKNEDPFSQVDLEFFADYIATRATEVKEDPNDEIDAVLIADFEAHEWFHKGPLEDLLKCIDEDKLLDEMKKRHEDYCDTENLCYECMAPMQTTPATHEEPAEYWCPNGCS